MHYSYSSVHYSLLRRQLLFPTPKYIPTFQPEETIFLSNLYRTTLGNIRGHCDPNSLVAKPLLFLSARPNFRYGLKAWNKFNYFLVERSVYIWDLGVGNKSYLRRRLSSLRNLKSISILDRNGIFFFA
jgi:hypothetical protein